MRNTIELKLLPKYYNEVRSGEKTFELRKDDRGYQVGDTLILKEWTGEKYTGNLLIRRISYILRDVPEFGLEKEYCILGLALPVSEKNFDVPRSVSEVGVPAWHK